MSLLEEAKKVHTQRKHDPVTHEQIELALAWLKGEVAGTQCQHILSTHTRQNWQSKASTILRSAYRQGYIKIVEPNKL